MFKSVLKIPGSYCQRSQFSERTEWVFEEFCETDTAQQQWGGKDPNFKKKKKKKKEKKHLKIYFPKYSTLFNFLFSPTKPLGIIP